jgi:hypothetical protein
MAFESLTRGESLIVLFAFAGATVLTLISWIRRVASRSAPDPWPWDIELAIKARVAVPLCTNCVYRQVVRQWFCPRCGFPAGEFVTTMPYLHIFALGESMRRGVMGPPEKGFVRALFLVLFSTCQYGIFAPIYWFWMVRKARGRPIGAYSRNNFTFDQSFRFD